jgi:hypothetical protein
MAKDLLVALDDRPGGLASIGEALGNAGINIEGLAGFGYQGRGLVHLLVEDGAAGRAALTAAGIAVEDESDVIVLPLPEDAGAPGTLGRQARKVADAGVNLRFVYVATGDRVIIGADDVDAARAAIGS